jgi:cysteine-rich repeat protein
LGEACDDGNANEDDSCRNDCTVILCGDGILDPSEFCDDGNNVNGDGCSAFCTSELIK